MIEIVKRSSKGWVARIVNVTGWRPVQSLAEALELEL